MRGREWLWFVFTIGYVALMVPPRYWPWRPLEHEILDSIRLALTFLAFLLAPVAFYYFMLKDTRKSGLGSLRRRRMARQGLERERAQESPPEAEEPGPEPSPESRSA